MIQQITKVGISYPPLSVDYLKLICEHMKNPEFSRSPCGFFKSKSQQGNYIPSFVIGLLDYHVRELC